MEIWNTVKIKDFIAYVNDCKRQGLDDRQIATRLGIDISEFKEMCDDAFSGNEIKPREIQHNEKANIQKKADVVKPVSGADVGIGMEGPKTEEHREKVDGIFYVPQNEDRFMNEPILGKAETDAEKSTE